MKNRQQGKEYTPEEREEIVQSLVPYFRLAYSVKKACELAEVCHTTVYGWLKDDVTLCTRIKAWQGEVSAAARANIAKAVGKGDLSQSQFYLTRGPEKKDWSGREEIGEPTEEYDLDKELEEKMKEFL